jgi:hypothetical protein
MERRDFLGLVTAMAAIVPITGKRRIEIDGDPPRPEEIVKQEEISTHAKHDGCTECVRLNGVDLTPFTRSISVEQNAPVEEVTTFGEWETLMPIGPPSTTISLSLLWSDGPPPINADWFGSAMPLEVGTKSGSFHCKVLLDKYETRHSPHELGRCEVTLRSTGPAEWRQA